MSLGMIVRQPRHVIAKLNGWSESEEHEVLDRTKGAEWGPDREPVFSVAECRLRTFEVRIEPAATVRSAIALWNAEREAFLKREQEEHDRRDECLKRQYEVIDHFKQQVDGYVEDSMTTRDYVRVSMKAVANTFHEPPYLSVKEVAKLTGWEEPLVRKYVRKGLFKNSLLPSAAGNGQHKKFDPVKVMEDIKVIKNKAGTKSRRKCK